VRSIRIFPHIAMAILTLGLASGTHASDANLESATHEEIEPLGATAESRFEKLVTFCMTREGNLLACDAGTERVRKLDPEGKTLAEWEIGFAPYAIGVCPDGIVYVAGHGRVAKLSQRGEVLGTVTAGEAGFTDGKPSGITATETDVFLGIGSEGTLKSRSSVFRLDGDLTAAAKVMDDLRACCQRLDLVAKDGKLYVPENARHRVLTCDREGNVLAKWGARDRTAIEGFASCCNPMNLCFDSNGVLYTAEAGLGRIKRYTPDGTFLGLVGYVGVERFNRASRLAVSCSNISVAVSQDGSRVYVLDLKNNIIRRLVKKNSSGSGPAN
jgi:sugar lactone lactonase YvrE